ncbi:32151_t:CDS:1, partial [Racocetra persica]
EYVYLKLRQWHKMMKNFNPTKKNSLFLNANKFEQLMNISFELDKIHKAGLISRSSRSKNLSPNFVLFTCLAPEVLTDLSDEDHATSAADIFSM